MVIINLNDIFIISNPSFGMDNKIGNDGKIFTYLTKKKKVAWCHSRFICLVLMEAAPTCRHLFFLVVRPNLFLDVIFSFMFHVLNS